jgi:hypothetical protein
MLSLEISELNRKVTLGERALSYPLTEPVSTEPVLVAYTGILPRELQKRIVVAAPAWTDLTDDERSSIEAKWAVEVLGMNRYGVIIESQTVNQSTSGTNAGAALGSTLAQTNYIDNAFRPGNQYSATQQVGAGIIGALIGATFDKQPQARYLTRYSVRLADGNIQMTDDVRGSPFKLPTTACVQFPTLDMSDQSLCTQSSDSLRKRLLDRK